MRALTVEQIEKRYESGFGQGVGENYQPWLQVHDVPSRGRSTRLNGRKVERMHLTFSDIERHTLLAVQRLDDVTDIREQFPLWPIVETQEIAAELNIQHPAHPTGRMPILMTSDLLLTVRKGRQELLEVIACKHSQDLGRRRTLEKLEIERVYWERRGAQWTIVTELDLSNGFVSNLEWIDECYDISPDTIAPDDVALAMRHLRETLPKMEISPLHKTCQRCDRDLGLETGNSIAVFRHALSRKIWRVPLGEKIEPTKPLPKPILAALCSSISARAA